MCHCHAGKESGAMNHHRRSARLSLLGSAPLKAKLYVYAMRTGFVWIELSSDPEVLEFALSSNPLEVVEHVDPEITVIAEAGRYVAKAAAQR
jgi:hypothetical protein